MHLRESSTLRFLGLCPGTHGRYGCNFLEHAGRGSFHSVHSIHMCGWTSHLICTDFGEEANQRIFNVPFNSSALWTL